MPNITLFLASSTAARAQAKALMSSLSTEYVKFLPWWEAFTPGRTLLAELDALRTRVQGALLLISPESTSVVRGKQVTVPNLNVLFEFGFYYGAFPKERVAIVKYGEFYLPSDLGGYIHISGSASFRRGGALRVAKRTKTEFGRWVESPGFSSPSSLPQQAAQSGSPYLLTKEDNQRLLNGGRRVISPGLGRDW